MKRTPRSKKSTHKNKPGTGKQVRRDTDKNPDNYLTKNPVWMFGDLDVGSTWCPIGTLSLECFQNEILPKLQNFETMTWKRIIDGGSHSVDVARLISPARKRLESNRINTDSLFSLRLTGRKRIWGIRNNHVLRLLWWDPEHAICPAPKKHT